MFYDGLFHDHYVGNVFLSPSGLIISFPYKNTRRMHDYTIERWNDVYETLFQCRNRVGGEIVVDSAFHS